MPPVNTHYQELLERIYANVWPVVQSLREGQVASYIPELADVDPKQFGMAVYALDGSTAAVGAATTRFSIQSISKLFALALAMHEEGESVWERVGREPSGNPFNSLVQLEYENGKPRNPFINAGALVVTDMLLQSKYGADGVLSFCRKLADSPQVRIDPLVAKSELQTAHRNFAMASFIKSFGNLQSSVSEVLQAYCSNCAIEMNCAELARAVGFIAARGKHGAQTMLDASSARRLSAVMLTCGTYDAAGDFAFRVGLPAKSGVGGGIVAVIPGKAGVCVWSPALEPSGNSYAGSIALEMLAALGGDSIF